MTRTVECSAAVHYNDSSDPPMDLRRLGESWAGRYGLAAVAVGLGTALRLALDPQLHDGSPFVTLILAIVVAARWGGSGPGAFATVFGGLASTWLFLAPRHSFAVDQSADQAGLLLYLIMGGATAIVGGGLRDSSRRLAVARDITRRNRIEAEEVLRTTERLYRTIGESIDFGVWVCDAEGRNVFASDSFLRLVGMTQEECSELGWARVLHPEDALRTLAAWEECVRTHGHWDVEHRFRGVDGNWHPVLARGGPVRNERGQVVAWCGINLDISHLKAAEAQLRESDRRKDEFLAMLAHELRNPLASIGNALQVQMLAEADDQAVARAREIAGRQLHQLTRLVDDLLDVSRIVVGKITLRPERVDLAQVVDRAVETSRPLVEQRGHALTIALPAEPAWLDADILRLSQAFSNLLNNAAKFTEPGGRVSLRAEEEGDWIVVRVRDSGIGIPAETLPRVFEMFAQGRRARDVEEGLGLGLSLVRRLVEKHGGTVAATSEGPGRGSTFTVRLPRASPPEIQRAPLPRPLRSSRAPGRRALVVDDNADSAESLAMLLTLQGHDVRVAHGGEEALAVFRDHRPEVVLLDIGLPDIDGHEVARRIREGGGAAGVLLVALTGWGQSEDRQRSKEAGFDRHLTKPVEPAVLQSLFEESPRSPDRT